MAVLGENHPLFKKCVKNETLTYKEAFRKIDEKLNGIFQQKRVMNCLEKLRTSNLEQGLVYEEICVVALKNR